MNLNVENIDVTLKIIDRMAKLHSLFWGKNVKELFPKLKGSCDSIFCPFFETFISERRNFFISKWRHTLNSFQIEKCNYIFDNFSDIQRRFSLGNNITFIHGDIKSPNIFYDMDNMCEPCFIDWQHCAIGKGVQDLIFFLIESFDIEKIKIYYPIFKYYYFQKLKEYGIQNYTMEEYENNLKNATYLTNKIDTLSNDIELYLVSKADDIGFKIMTDPQYSIEQFSDYPKLIEALKERGIQ